MGSDYEYVGKNMPRKDALEKVLGQARFVADMQLPGMLHAGFLRSPHAHARIAEIYSDRATTLPGVRAVITHKDVPKISCSGRKFEYALNDVVCYAGEEVAAVAAMSKEVVKDALELLDVEYEVLPAVFDAESAMRPGAPLVHPEYGTNIYSGADFDPIPRMGSGGWLSIAIGDVDKGMAGADHIVEGVFESPAQATCSPMPTSVVCEWRGNDLTCWADTQIPWFVAKDLARVFDIPVSNVRVIASTTVGGYGAKAPDKIAVLTALLARKTGRPVKAFFSRAEEFVAFRHRPKYKIYGKIGVNKDGTITAMHHKAIGNCGSDPPFCLEIMSSSIAATGGTLYPISAGKFEGCMVMTNTSDISPMMGMGNQEAGLGVERLVDEAAEVIGMDPVAFRLKNCARYGTRAVTRRDVLGLSHDQLEHRPERVDWGIVGHDFGLSECIEKVAKVSGWKRKWKGWREPVAVNGARRRGIGIGIGMHMSEYRLYSATVKMNQDGTAVVLSSAPEQGQGLKTAMAQVVAETLGIGYESVNVILADTATTPEGWGTVASGGTSSAITAAKFAAEDAMRQLMRVVADNLDVDPGDLEVKNGRINVLGQSERNMPLSVACLLSYQITGTAVNPSPDSIIDQETGKVIKSYASGATIAEVDVDVETGELDVLMLTSANDCGVAINPRIAVNQVDLGLNISNGYVRSEEFVIDEQTGVMLNPSLLDYKIMTFLDMPENENTHELLVESPCAWGAFGAKGFSETSSVSPAPAIANAIYNAIGIRLRGERFSPDIILEAVNRKH